MKERKKKEPKKRIIYDNYDTDFEQSKDELFELQAEESGWETPDDIPDDEVYAFMNDEEELRWEDETAHLERFFDDGAFLLMGTIGRWDGPAAGGFIFRSFKEMYKAWRDCDYIKLFDMNGHFMIQCDHHDGTNRFEVRELTQAGVEYADRHDWDMNTKELHTKLWNSSKYTRLPHYAHRVYGCRKVEYVPA